MNTPDLTRKCVILYALFDPILSALTQFELTKQTGCWHTAKPHRVRQCPVFKDLYMRDVAPPHPGEILRDEILPRLALTRKALAKHLGISVRRLYDLLSERAPITLDLARRLGTALGHGPRYWLGLQMQHDIWQSEQPHALAVKPITRRRASSRQG
jgi:antitoxin HigA-1